MSRYGGKEPIHGGDASKPLVLEHFGIQSARVIAVVISDPSAVRAITAVARKLNPKVHIVAVSYTHLDVYKRQSWRFMVAPGDCSPSRSVVSKIMTRLDMGFSLESFSRKQSVSVPTPPDATSLNYTVLLLFSVKKISYAEGRDREPL